MEMLQAKFQYYNSQVDKELLKYPQIVKLEQQIGIPKTYLAASVIGIVFVLIFFNVWGSLFSNIIGWLYPAYASFKAIESAKKTDDTQWLTYWTVFGFFNIVEFFSNIVLYWVPFYFLIKTVFLLWLSLPPFNGAKIVYARGIRPFLLEHEDAVDETLDKWKRKIDVDSREVFESSSNYDG